MKEKIVVGSDHAGFELKEGIKSYLEKKGYEVLDVGTDSAESVDYPDYAYKVADEIKDDIKGILVCGSGVGVSIAANRRKGVRAALAFNTEIAKLSRQHNNANVICLSGRFTSLEDAKKIVDVFLKTPFSTEERHGKRVKKLG
ncbi:ribose 5-phosphate isomerase B [Nanoarchaeota archaeon]